jgi:hypothetical protein
MVRRSTIIGALALIALIGGVRTQLPSQTISVEPEAAIQAHGTPTLPDVQHRLAEVKRRMLRMQEAKVASYPSPMTQKEYIEAQREIARGEYRKAMNNLNQAEQELDGVPNWARH